MSHLVQCASQIFVKTELDNPGCSHKYRAAKFIVDQAVTSGDIIPGETTVIEKTGGNFGFGLLMACQAHDVGVELAIGLTFSQRKRSLLEFLGARLIGKEMLVAGMTPKEVVQYHLDEQRALGKRYFYTDQFQNRMGVEAHRQQTGVELVSQLEQREDVGREVVLIGGAGTGASFTGISLALRDAGFRFTTVLVEPEGCDMQSGLFTEHRIEGISVGVPAPFLDWGLVHEVQSVRLQEVLEAQRWFYLQTGIFVGNSSAANIAVARNIRESKRFDGVPVVTVAYDSGLWYNDFIAITV